MREIALDTETTGLDPVSGHRVVEIGCVEMVNRIKTGKVFHTYLNPERDMPESAFKVHGLSAEFLADKPRFAEKAEEFLAFIGDAALVIHNAEFDLKFLNHELGRLPREAIPFERAVDTVRIARAKFPGSPANLDALCRRFSIDLSKRDLHGALLDADLLSMVYLELMGGRQATLLAESATVAEIVEQEVERVFREPRVFTLREDEIAAHAAFIAKFKNPLWALYDQPSQEGSA